jgi:hypothetical protein
VFPFFATGVSTTRVVLVANLPSVSLIPVVHLQISPQIFEKLGNDPNAIIRDLVEDDSRKKTRSKKSRDTVPLNLDEEKKRSIFECADSNRTVVVKINKKYIFIIGTYVNIHL